MTAPIVTWTEADGQTVISKWQMGKVNAGFASEEKNILIWNNYAGVDNLSDMQEVRITTTDDAGDTMDVVVDKWVEVRCNSADETEFTQIGGETMHLLSARDQEPGRILGSANGGMLTDSANYADITVFTQPPLNVPAGLRPFKLRVIYYYT